MHECTSSTLKITVERENLITFYPNLTYNLLGIKLTQTLNVLFVDEWLGIATNLLFYLTI